LPSARPGRNPDSTCATTKVMDRLTGLIWCRHANLAEFPLTWQESLDFVATMNREQRFGQHDWRMPNRRELRSLLNLQAKLPALPERHPFIDVFNGWYWTSTTAAISRGDAWYVAIDGARMFYGGKDQSFMLLAGTRRRSVCCPAYRPSPVLRRCRQRHCMRRFRSGTANGVTVPHGLNPASKLSRRRAGSPPPTCSGAVARTSSAQPVVWSEALAIVAQAKPRRRGETSGGCQRSTNWSRWWIVPATARPCRPAILSSMCRISTGRLPPACSSLIGPGPCIWKKARPALGKSATQNFQYGPWQPR